jgi:hypothetical protein
MPLTGRLWWQREHVWGVELEGELHAATSVELVGATVRTKVSPDGAFALPSGPLAIVEFEAQAVILTSNSETRTYHAVTPANDNNRAEEQE